MTRYHFTAPLVASVLLHVAGLASASRLVELSGEKLPMELIPIQVVTAEPPPPVSLTQPQAKPPTPRAAPKITPPPRIETPPLPPATQPLTSPPPLPTEAPPDPPPPSPAKEEPRPAPVIQLPTTTLDDPPGNVIGPATKTEGAPSSAPAEGGEAGAGRLSAKGDLAVLPGTGAGGGSGGPGKSGLGLGVADGGPKVPGLPIDITKLRGGYQIKPRYPESARRQGIEGTALLRFQVLTDGRVGEVLVERSAGFSDLDLAAVEAIKRWRFEPARRDQQAVAAWAVLPVEFRLKR